MTHTVTLIPGDGIGPAITEATLSVLAAAGAPIDWERREAGLTAAEHGNDLLPQETLDSIERNRFCLKGPLTTPIGAGFRSINVALRKHFDLYANVDATAMQLVLDPYQFDVIFTENMFGDILSDLAAGLVGGLGFAPGVNIGKDVALFEAVHGSAPDIAGRNVANPTALLLAACMLLEHLGLAETAARVRASLRALVEEGHAVTRDLGGTAGTSEFADAVSRRLENVDAPV
jgi:isocitrate/isopropylmalate dehydrogenase